MGQLFKFHKMFEMIGQDCGDYKYDRPKMCQFW